jgi:hypothetical protein
MKVKVYVVDFEIPSRVKTWGLRIAIPMVLLVGGGVAFAGLPGGYADGQPLTAAELSANFNYLQNEIAGDAGFANQLASVQGEVHPASAFHAWATASPQFASGTPTPIAFNQVEFDLGSEYDATTGVFTAKNAGYYLVQCQVMFYNSTSSTAYEIGLTIQDNGAEIGAMSWDVPWDAFPEPEATNLVQVAAGDALTCVVAQYSGATQTLFLGDPKRVTFSAARLY